MPNTKNNASLDASNRSNSVAVATVSNQTRQTFFKRLFVAAALVATSAAFAGCVVHDHHGHGGHHGGHGGGHHGGHGGHH